MVGIGNVFSLSNTSAMRSASALFSAGENSATCRIDLRSAPAEKLLPRAARMTARTSCRTARRVEGGAQRVHDRVVEGVMRLGAG